MLFVGVQVTVAGAALMILGFPFASHLAVVLVVGIFSVLIVRQMIARRQSKCERAPVGPLSPDERAKARSKLVRSYSRSPNC